MLALDEGVAMIFGKFKFSLARIKITPEQHCPFQVTVEEKCPDSSGLSGNISLPQAEGTVTELLILLFFRVHSDVIGFGK